MNEPPALGHERTIWNGTMHVRFYEVQYAEGNLEGRALVFETDLGKRYAVVFPMDWDALTDDALLSLAEQAPD